MAEYFSYFIHESLIDLQYLEAGVCLKVQQKCYIVDQEFEDTQPPHPEQLIKV